MRLRLLVDSQEYWESLRADLQAARREVFAQALSFEGDSAGLAMAKALLECRAADRRVVVDSFTLHYLSDCWVAKPAFLLGGALRREVLATRRMFEDLGAGGVGVRFVNPFGFLYRRGPARNHKKLVVIDGRVAYIGGINFSDHNFAWRDLMLRIEDEEIVAALRADFLATDAGENRAVEAAFPDFTLLSFDGQTNPARFQRLLGLIDQARESVVAHCAYVTPPWSDALLRAAARGVRVTLVMPEHTNWPATRDLAVDGARWGGLEVLLYQDRMSHLKTVLVDGRTLVLGSANLDFWSYFFQQELVGLVTDEAVIDDYRRRVLLPDLAASKPVESGGSRWTGRRARLELMLMRTVLLLANPRREP